MAEPIFSQTWVDAWARELAASAPYRQAAQTWEGSVLLETPEDGDSPWQAVFLDLWHGECREAKTAAEADRDWPFRIESLLSPEEEGLDIIGMLGQRTCSLTAEKFLDPVIALGDAIDDFVRKPFRRPFAPPTPLE